MPMPPQLQGTAVGRPKGSINIFSKRAVDKLAELGFDPIEEMIRQLDDIDKTIEMLRAKPNPSHVAISNLLSVRQKCASELMRYGYARVTESTEIITPELKPMSITMTHKKEPSDIPSDNA